MKNWLEKMLPGNAADHVSPDSTCSSSNDYSPHQWERFSGVIEQYVNQLLLSKEKDDEIHHEEKNEALMKECSAELHMPENVIAAEERNQVLKCRIQNAQDTIKLNREQTDAAKARREKAEWAVNICSTLAEELQACINEEVVKKINLNRTLDSREDELNELHSEVEEKRSKLNSVLELQQELSDKLCLSSYAKSRAEVQLDKAVRARADMVEEIEELREHRNVLQRRIEFCREKDAIRKVSKVDGLVFDFREFTAAEIVSATENFSEKLRLKSAGNRTNVYRGQINHKKVAIKMFDPANEQSREAFTAEVKLLSLVRHPNLLAVVGFCSELSCLVFEYMHNGSLHDALLSTKRSCKRQNASLSWHARIQIAFDICSAVNFLHKAKPMPISHGNLKPTKILLKNNVAKVAGFKAPSPNGILDIGTDILAFGNLILLLLTGKNWHGAVDTATVIRSLDRSAEEWPMHLATELCSIAMRCLSDSNGIPEECVKSMPMREINHVKKQADQLTANGKSHVLGEDCIDDLDLNNIASAFLCPIHQDVMQNPHVAADGFSYELEAIEEWLESGHDTSPVTNLRLKHKFLIPNHTLRSLIQDWQKERWASTT